MACALTVKHRPKVVNITFVRPKEQPASEEVSTNMAYEQIQYDVADYIATITLNRPDRLNAWTPVMESEVFDAMQKADTDDKVRVVILTGAGRGFCAGADMQNL